MVTREQVVAGLREVVDPEIGINLVDLGLIKQVLIEEDRIHVKMILTAPGCPLARYLLAQVQQKVESLAGGKPVAVELLNEPWEPRGLRVEE